MATVASENARYPTSDGKPMAETDLHRNLMVALIAMLQDWFAANPMVYVSGNLLLFYVRGNKRKHLAPDVFVVDGVPKRLRENYLLWDEGKGPDFVIELTSSSTRKEDTAKKFELYRDVLKVREYFLFDPQGDYLKPRLQGYRLQDGAYLPIAPVHGRLPSETVSLHLEQQGSLLKLYEPVAGRWLLTPQETALQERLARQQETVARQQEAEARRRVEAENEELREQIERLRRGSSD